MSNKEQAKQIVAFKLYSMQPVLNSQAIASHKQTLPHPAIRN
nr:hypothetical protein [Hassalia byssoidea]